jgi:hypothetical protein
MIGVYNGVENMVTEAIDCIPSNNCEQCLLNVLTADRRNACLEIKSVAETLRRNKRLKGE